MRRVIHPARNRSPLLLTALMVLAVCSPGKSAAEIDPVINLSGSYYLDSRDFATASVAVASDRLPLGISFWGFTDFHGDHDSGSLALKRSFSEYRLSHGFLGEVTGIEGLGMQVELNALSGSGNDVVRTGLTYRHALGPKGWLQWRLFPLETDNNGGQASLIFNFPISARAHVKGFADYNVVDGQANRWVIEPELNIQLTDRLWALLEYRYNQYEAAAPLISGSAIAIGVRYHFTQ